MGGKEEKFLVVVESPAKAKTINKFLGKEYTVKACMGHVRDLPEGELGVDIENGFQPKYVTIRGKGKIIEDLRQVAKSTKTIFLATDPDREGEAIAWHVADLIAKQDGNVRRVLFNEITKDAVLKAMTHPLGLDLHKVNAQQARRILDRLVGYRVSPFLWKTLAGGLSAGRVQSVTLRLVCERDKEIAEFKPEEYWTIVAEVQGEQTIPFRANLVKHKGRNFRIPNKEKASQVVSELKKSLFSVLKIETKEQKKDPSPPFTTSTLQQEAVRRLNFSTSKTMLIAQQLYEGIELGKGESVGLITYMRTDSTRIAPEAIAEVRERIPLLFGVEYIPAKPRVYSVKKGAQDAHEAIRPTLAAREPKAIKKYLTQDQFRLYELIWSRFVACQMCSAIFNVTTIEIEAGDYLFRAIGSEVKFRGFMVLYTESKEEEEKTTESVIPHNLRKGERLTLLGLFSEQHFTKPPPHYTEATLVKELESKGIGRPSTYAPIISTILERDYVRKEKGKLIASDLGKTVNSLLVGSFPDIFDVYFTARMERDLDRIEMGEDDWVDVVKEFYTPFKKSLEQLDGHKTEIKKSLQEETDQVCELCGKPMVIKWSRWGRFLSCSGYPECKNAKPLNGQKEQPQLAGIKCNKCGSEMVIRNGRYGRFLACSAYPKCKNTIPFDTNISCPEPGCGGNIVQRRTKKGKVFYGCTRYPNCKFASWDKPVNKICSECGSNYLVEKSSEKDKILKCPNCKTEFEADLIDAVANG